MRTVFETCTPREDVLTGALPETQFAADLHAVVTEAPHAPALYRDAATFFAYTYPTRGLQNLVREVFGRFTGTPGASPALRLETSFGGGKTHNLIALWHIARQPSAAASAAGAWLPRGLLPTERVDPVALIGDKYGASEVAAHGGVLTRTLWGEMAWQLGGYEVMREADEQRLAPAETRLDQLLAGRRVLVLLDELPGYLRAAKGQRVGAGTLADQTLVFFRLLLGYAATHPDVVVVYTLSEREDAFSRERDEIIEQVTEARSVSAKQERVMTPIGEEEVAHVLRRRLFLAVHEAAAAEVAAGYVDHLRRIRAQGAPLPPHVEDPAFQERIRASYPFHPELLDTLYRKTCSFPTFQRVRGALRLLAATVRGLWRDRPADAFLIQSSDIDLSHPVVREELTSRIDRSRLVAAIAEDIWSEHGNAHAQQFDRDWAAKGFPQLCRRVAQAVFLHSLVHHAAPGVAGAEPAEVHLACARPGLPFDLVDKALGQIDERFWYAEFDGRRYLFHDEPTIKKLIETAVFSVGVIAAKDAARQKVQELFEGPIFDAIFFPTGPEAVRDRPGKPVLVLLDFDHVSVEGGATEVPAPIEEIFQRAGEDRSFRHYQNNLVVLAADAAKKETMIEAARKARGIESLLGSNELRKRLSSESVKKLQQAADTAQLEYRVAVTNAYCHLFYRSLHDGRIERYELPPQDSADAKRPAQAVLRAALEQLGKALTRDLAPEWVLDRVWNEGGEGEAQLSLAELLDRFARKPRTYLLFDEGLQRLRQTVRRGVERELWVYVDERTGTVYRKERPPAAEEVRFGPDAVLLTPALAAKRYPRKPPEPDKPPEASRGAPPIEPLPGVHGPPPPPWTKTWQAEADGPARKAFAALADRMTEGGADSLREIELAVSGVESTKRILDAWSALTTALAQAALVVEHELVVRGGSAEGLSLTFRGPARLFFRLRDGIRAGLEGAEPDDFVVTRLRARFSEPVAVSDPRFAALAKDLEETYRCGPVGLKAR